MSTGAVITLYGNGKSLAKVYCHEDGMPMRLGKKLAEFLSGRIVYNGVVEGETAAGAGCLAAQVIAHLKDGPGGVHVIDLFTENAGEEFRYYISAKTGEEPLLKIDAVRGRVVTNLYADYASNVLKAIESEER